MIEKENTIEESTLNSRSVCGDGRGELGTEEVISGKSRKQWGG